MATETDVEAILTAARITAAAELAAGLMRSASKGEWHAAAKPFEREEAAVEAFERIFVRLEKRAQQSKSASAPAVAPPAAAEAAAPVEPSSEAE